MTAELPMTTPPQLARRWGVDAGKVLALIKSGQLKAINLAVNSAGERPRYRISETSIKEFEEARASKPKPLVRRRRMATAPTKEYF